MRLTGSEQPRRIVHLASLAVVVLFLSIAAPLAVGVQQPEKLYRIGMLERTSTAINAANLNGFRQGLRELGYVRGRASSSSTDRPTAATSGFRTWRLSWFA